ncbi:Putative hydrolase [Paraburkholderia xenovorans LB400]|uniref:Hydrolase n=1 Tax=Paraburkholderia xenovorans (strain LB400) TaxID=266265 RepID=Q13HG5_PARXL|nr:Putative hydrolase [Paraburkholderia xenovorans LB400]
MEEDGRLPTGKLPSAIGKNHRIAVVDTHFHLWKSQEIAPPSGIMADPSLFRDFDWSDYELAMQGVALEAAIHVQVHHGSEKAKSEYGRVERFAAEHAPIAGMIAWAPLESPGVEREIAELAQSPLVAGVRRLTQQEPDELFCARPQFVAGAKLLASYGLVCEVCVLEHQLKGVIALASACPELTIILDHLGKPHLAEPPTEHWLENMRILGMLENVVCKVAPTPLWASDPPLTAAHAAPFIEYVAEHFGWDRLIYGSNWPPLRILTDDASQWADIVFKTLHWAKADELGRLFSENARRIFRLNKGHR